MSDVAIRAEGLGKAYRLGSKEETPDTLVGAALSLAKSPWRNFRNLGKLDVGLADKQESDMIWALRDVSFSIKHGDVVGVIGRNGAGKSTLLKLLCRITEPTHGEARIHGRIGSLLEVGTGFHPDLTGRENVYMNGTILGMRKAEIDANFDEIVAFSGVEKFLDTPIKRYSSGMQVRLAFAVAAHLNPEILIIDEVLAVGDVEFQNKCLDKMRSVAREGRTVIFVSHNIGLVRQLCNRSIVLAKGQLEVASDVEEGLQHYFQQLNQGNHEEGDDQSNWRPSSSQIVEEVRLSDLHGNPKTVFGTCEPIIVEIDVAWPDQLGTESRDAAVIIEDAFGQMLGTAATYLAPKATYPFRETIRCKIIDLPLAPGTYSLTIKAGGLKTKVLQETHERIARIRIEPTNYYGSGLMPNRHRGMVLVRSEWS